MEIEIGKTYKTVSGKEIIIETYIDDWKLYRSNIGIDYNKDGKASYALMFRGRFNYPEYDLVL